MLRRLLPLVLWSARSAGLASLVACQADLRGRQPPGPGAPGSWDFEITPYAQGPWMNGELVSKGGEIVGGGPAWGAGLRAGAFREAGWGVLLDYAFLDTEGSLDEERFVFDPHVQQQTAGVFVARRLPARPGVDLYAGARWWDVDTSFTTRFLPPQQDGLREANEAWLDPTVGLRWVSSGHGAWRAVARGELGGFGVGSDLAWMSSLGFRYHWTPSAALEVDYYGQGVRYETGTGLDAFDYDAIWHGPRVGLFFSF